MKQMQKMQRPLPPKKKPHGAATAKRVAKSAAAAKRPSGAKKPAEAQWEVAKRVTVEVDAELAAVLEAYERAGMNVAKVLMGILADLRLKKSAASAPQKKSAVGGSKISLTMRQTKGSKGECSRR